MKMLPADLAAAPPKWWLGAALTGGHNVHSDDPPGIDGHRMSNLRSRNGRIRLRISPRLNIKEKPRSTGWD